MIEIDELGRRRFTSSCHWAFCASRDACGTRAGPRTDALAANWLLRDDGEAKWATGVHHVEVAAKACAEMAALPASMVGLRVTQMWAPAEILGLPRDLEWVTVALSVDLAPGGCAVVERPGGGPGVGGDDPAVEVPDPVPGAVRSWAGVEPSHRPPAAGQGQQRWCARGRPNCPAGGPSAAAGLTEPPPEQTEARLDDELRIGLAALRARTGEYEERRWGRGRLAVTADASQ